MSDLLELSCCYLSTFVELVDDLSRGSVRHLALTSRSPELASVLVVSPELTWSLESPSPHVGSRVPPHGVVPSSERPHRRVSEIFILSELSSLNESRMARSLCLFTKTFRSSLTFTSQVLTLTKQ